MNRFLTTILILFLSYSQQAFSQLQSNSLNYRTKIEDAHLYFKDSKSVHSSVLPLINNRTEAKKKGTIVLDYRKGNTHIYPLADIGGGYSLGTNTSNEMYTAGLGLGLDYNRKKFFFSGKLLPYYAKSGFVRDSIQHNLNMDPGTGRAIANNIYLQNELIIGYRPNRFFTFLGGNGRNFFGEGYRSLILSDNAGPNPFFKIETTFGDIKYVNLYHAWKDNTVDPTNKALDDRKFAAMHYISWNITREFNLSIFETVVWQSNDTLINRGFDPNYINPVVFYRPVEYGNGSADNVLLGANMSFKFNEKHSLYTQFILDDFLLKEIRARSRWWANKYGFQFGYKSNRFLNKENLYFQAEFNTVRPFTFSHKHSVQSYGHMNAAVTHPIGANFFEVLGILSYKKNDFRFTNKLTYSSYGIDSSATSYGQNIFVSYNNREGEYDHLIMQGLKKNVLNETVIVEHPLYKPIGLYLHATYNWRMELTIYGIQNNHSFMVGIHSRLWNRYTDY